MDNKVTTGTLFLIPTTIGSEPLNHSLAPYTLEVIHTIQVFIVEEVKTAIRFLKKAGHPLAIDALTFIVYNEHSKENDTQEALNHLHQGRTVGLLSEAGAPCVADPGAIIVRAAHAQGIRVIPLTGPSSILLSLMASGMNGQRFVFHGYLPIDRHQLVRKLKEMEKDVFRNDQTQIFIEAPYRNHRLLEAILQNCHQDISLCIATNIFQPDEFILTLTVGEWKKRHPDLHKKNTVFLIYK